MNPSPPLSPIVAPFASASFSLFVATTVLLVCHFAANFPLFVSRPLFSLPNGATNRTFKNPPLSNRPILLKDPILMFAIAAATLLASPFLLCQTVARFPCSNGGVPILRTEKGHVGTDSGFSCQCPNEYFGTFCEYRTKSAPDDDDTAQPNGHQQQQFSSLVDKFGILFPPPPGSLPVNTATAERHAVVPDDWHWQDAIVNLLVCVFFLLILPSLVVYVVRILYLLLKRCHHRNRNIPHLATAARSATMPTPPPQYFPPVDSSSSSFRFRPTPSGRHRSESPAITEVTVQLPASICRPLHGTHSLNLRPTTSLTLHEFHDLLLAMQQEMVAEQRRARHGTQNRLAPSGVAFAQSPPVPPAGPPPNYESALLSARYP